jgi:hypothetical protein
MESPSRFGTPGNAAREGRSPVASSPRFVGNPGFSFFKGRKDAIDTAGVLTQRASKIFAGNIPEKDATVVTRFKAAGAIPLAKTNLPEFSAWQETDNLVTGLSRSP